jgi:hypothetical protein
MLAKLGEVGGKFLAQQKLKFPRFLSWACSGWDRLLVGDCISFQMSDIRSQLSDRKTIKTAFRGGVFAGVG